MAGGCGQGPPDGRYTTLRLLYWFFLLLAPHPTLAAEITDSAVTNETTLVPPTSTAEREEGKDDMETLVNITSQMAWALGILPSNTCESTCGAIAARPCCMGTCNCDKLCRLYSDCCPDFEEECPGEAGKPFTELQLKNNSYFKSYISRDWIGDAGGFSTIKEIQWIRTCPEGIDQTLREQCEKTLPISKANLLLHLPVVQNGFIFRNKYCTLCHRMTGPKTFITFIIECMNESIKAQIQMALRFQDVDRAFELVRTNECLISYNVAEIPQESLRFIRTSQSPIISDCPSSESVISAGSYSLESTSMCRMYQARVVIQLPVAHSTRTREFIYKNPHCALCNGVSLDDMRIRSICTLADCGVTSVFRSFTMLVDTAQSEDTAIGKVVTADGCRDGHIYDNLRDTCQSIQCPIGLVFKGGICSEEYKIVSQAFETGQDIYTIAIFGTLFPVNFHEGLPFLIDKVGSFAFVSELEFMDYDFQCSSLPRDGPTDVFLESGCFIIKFHVRKEFTISSQTFSKIQTIRHHVQNTYTSFRILGTYLYNYDISSFPKCTKGREMISKDVVIYPAGYGKQNVFVSNVGYTWETSSLPITVYQSHNGHTPSYQVSVQVCISDKETENIYYYNISSMELVTLIGNAISLFALLLGFFSICLTPEIKVIIRILLINLIVALFIAQSTFLLQGIFGLNATACWIVGIFQHYAWLVYFFMMNSVAIEMAWAFHNLKSLVHTQADISYKRRLAVLLIHGWMSPMLLITPSLILAQVDNHYLNPHYGRDTSCWLNNSKALLYFFVIPFCVIIGSNIMLIMSAIIAIRRNGAPAYSSSQERTYMQINIRLSTLMGLSWILGLVASYTKEDALWYVFIILNTLQGVILFSAFAAPHHAIQYIRSRLSTRSSG